MPFIIKVSPNFLGFMLLLVFQVSCASYSDQMKPVMRSYYSADYPKALEKLEKSKIKGQERNRLLYILEKATILERNGDFKEARKLYIEADKLADELYTVSLSKTASSFVINDSTTDYSGEDYEKVAIHTMLASSFLAENNVSAAAVEARKINNKLYEINGSYGEKANRYQDDAFARYLSGVIFESKRNYDSAIIEYQRSLKTYETSYRDLFGVRPPNQLVKALHKLYLKRGRQQKARRLEKKYNFINANSRYPQTEVVVFHQLGVVSPKKQKNFVWSMGSQVVRFSFPVIYPKNSYRFSKTGAKVDSDYVSSEVFQNYDYIAQKTLEDRKGRMLLKSGARLLIKGQMVEQTRQKYGDLAGVFANVFAVATETADTRSWMTLPSVIGVSRMGIGSGKKEVRIYTNGRQEKKRINSRKGDVKILVAK